MCVTTRKKAQMPWELYTNIIDQIVDKKLATNIALHVLGEPLLHKNITQAVDYAKQRGLDLILTTNGSLLTPELVQAFARSGLDELDISLETISPEQHAARQTDIDFATYYATILQAIRAARAYPAMRVRLSLMNTYSRVFFSVHKKFHISLQGRQFRAALRQLILDIFAAIDKEPPLALIDSLLQQARINSPQKIRIDDQIMIYAQLFMDWGNIFNNRKIHPAKIGYCNYAVKYPAILSDGRVTICCGDYDGAMSVGKVQDAPLESLFGSDAMRRVDEGFKKCLVRHPYCQRCLGSASRIYSIVAVHGVSFLADPPAACGTV
jgi:sulfatase maturation enzyme AslB (radical SAM superfamily)